MSIHFLYHIFFIIIFNYDYSLILMHFVISKSNVLVCALMHPHFFSISFQTPSFVFVWFIQLLPSFHISFLSKWQLLMTSLAVCLWKMTNHCVCYENIIFNFHLNAVCDCHANFFFIHVPLDVNGWFLPKKNHSIIWMSTILMSNNC